MVRVQAMKSMAIAAVAAMTVTSAVPTMASEIQPDGIWSLELREELGMSTRYREGPSAMRSGTIAKTELETLLNEFLKSPEGDAIRQSMGVEMPERLDAAELLSKMPAEIEIREIPTPSSRIIEIRYPGERRRMVLNSEMQGKTVLSRTPMRPMQGTACSQQVVTSLKIAFDSSERMTAEVNYTLNLRSGRPRSMFEPNCEQILHLLQTLSELPGEDDQENGLDLLMSELERRELLNRSLIAYLQSVSFDLRFDGIKEVKE